MSNDDLDRPALSRRDLLLFRLRVVVTGASMVGSAGLSLYLARHYSFDPALAREILNVIAVACVTMLSISPVVYEQALEGVRSYRRNEAEWTQLVAAQTATLWDIRQAQGDVGLSKDQSETMGGYQKALDDFAEIQERATKNTTALAGVLSRGYRNFICLGVFLFLVSIRGIADIHYLVGFHGFFSVLLALWGLIFLFSNKG